MTKLAIIGVAIALGALLVTGCSSGGSSKSSTSGSTAPTRTVNFNVALPEISRPTAQGKGINRPQPAAAAPAGYAEDEFFVCGTATSFDCGRRRPTTGSGRSTPGHDGRRTAPGHRAAPAGRRSSAAR